MGTAIGRRAKAPMILRLGGVVAGIVDPVSNCKSALVYQDAARMKSHTRKDSRYWYGVVIGEDAREQDTSVHRRSCRIVSRAER